MSQAQTTNFPESGFAAGQRSFPSSILDALPAHIALLDHYGVILTVNERWHRFAAANGAADGAYVGQSYLQVCDHACSKGCAEAEAAARGIREVLDGVRPHFEMEYPCHAPAELRWFRLMVSPLRDGEVEGAVVMHINITEQKLAEQAAETASKFKDEFLAALSHELRTPLTPVLLTVEALQGDRRLPSELGADLERIRRNVEREARLIDDLLDLTRIARGKVELRSEAVDVHALLRHAAETCTAETSKRGPEVTLDLAASDSWIRGDAARLEQVFWNLLSNSLKFTGPGGAVRVRTWNEPDGRLRVEVNDNGMGIEPAVLPHVFNAFEQGGGHVTRRFGGLGLGLAISKSLVDLHGGLIEARSEGTGRGTAFTVTLDTVQPAAEGAGPEASPHRETGRGLRLLLVEDHADTAEVMAELLQESGHRVTVARNLAEALSLADAATAGEDGAFDLVVSDLGLPDGSGLDLMRELSRRHGLRGIALSGYGTEQDVRDSLAAGFERHLVKPVGVRAIEAAIREVT